MSKFHLPPVSTSSFFTDPSVDIFLDDVDTGSSELSSTIYPEAPILSDDPTPAPPGPTPTPSGSSLPEPSCFGSAPNEPLILPSSPPTELHVPPLSDDSPPRRSTRHEPHSYREASSNPLWQQAMAEELQALDKTHTWDIVDLLPSKTPIGSKWVYKIKTRSDGSIERYKARLVAKGFYQEYGIDYEETFAPVARLTSVRSLLAVAAVRKWNLNQMDVKNAFLNGDLTEEVYMRPPPGYNHPPNKVCKFHRALYGLKQAPRAWFAKFSTTIQNFGFSSSQYDFALFIRKSARGIIFLLLYVDDMIITGDDNVGISDLKAFLSKQFQMKDLGTVSYFLGLEISSTSDGYYLTQAKYASDLLSCAGITDNKTASTPLEPTTRLTPLDGTPLPDATLYRQLVGSLVYLTVTRPDIAYVVHIVSQFMSAPRSAHFQAVLRILRYFKGTLFHGLYYSAHSSLELCAYSDADWAGDPTDRRSTTCYYFFLGDSLISWRSKKQSLVSRSSTEAEYRAIADTTQEFIWLRWLLSDMGVIHSTATKLCCDNQSAVQIARNDVFHDRTKHIEIDCHFIRQHVVRGSIRLLSVSSSDQTADIFTKAHPPGRFHDLVSKLKLVSALPP
ncbi:hypothetical protein RHGRI_034005 [Rhododendron griersonianum]|uniref:Reverse transcriptase Ty1/copia-type domain-containing protein n=1 Tax=Rhododendron griersonianum TaxID=479676 RepID=A0AAV6HZP3_9ERIC|nr:hypothetical protein RHGRI_034005 [Rhododendron griersonianum]